MPGKVANHGPISTTTINTVLDSMPVDPKVQGVAWYLLDKDGATYYDSGITPVQPAYTLKVLTPSTVQDFVLYACGSDGKNINPLVPGITPCAVVTLGANGGTVDPGQLVRDALGPGLDVDADGNLHVPVAGGITHDADGNVIFNPGNGLKTNPDGKIVIQNGSTFSFDGSGNLLLNTGNGVTLDAGGNVIVKASGGLTFNAGGTLVPNFGYNVGTNASGQIVVPPSSLGLVEFGGAYQPYGFYFGLPSPYDTSVPKLIVNTVDWKVYRNTGGAWSKATDPADLIAGTITALVSMISPVISGGVLPEPRSR